MNVVVVGAGIIGASIAYTLSRRRGVQVTVVEQGSPGGGASGHSFAWTNAFDKEPYAYHALNRDSMELWHRFSRTLGVPEAFVCRGRLQVENTAEGAKTLRERVRVLQGWGYRCRIIDSDELKMLEPGLRVDAGSMAALSEVEGHVDVPVVINACLSSAREHGARLLTGASVTGLMRNQDNGALEAVSTSAGRIEADTVVLAGGTATPQLAAMAGVHIPHPVSPGIVIRTDPRPALLETVCVVHLPALSAERPDVHLRQTGDGVLQLGQGTQESLNEDDSQAHADDLLDRAAHFFPALKAARAIRQPVGYRPMPADGLPVLGAPERAPGVYIALMHSGVTLAPLVGELATLEIVDGARVDMLEPYRVERFN